MSERTSGARRPTRRLSKRIVDALKPGEIVWDSEVKGFGVRCQRSAKVYILKARAKGRQRWISIGEHGSPWTVDRARDRARMLRGAIADGQDPAEARDLAKGAPTINDLAKRYLAEHVAVRNKPSTAETFERLVERQIVPELGQRRVADVSRADVTKLHHSLRDTPRQANQTLAVLSKMMHLAEAWGMRPENSNPCRLVQRYRETERKRFLSDDELGKVGNAVSALEAEGKILPGAALAIRLAALTGCRMGEILALRWADVDFEGNAFLIHDAKAGGRVHAIGAAVVALLSATDRSGSWVVWSTDPENPMPVATLSNSWERVRTRAGLPDVRFHDLRHGFGTFAGQAGANAFLVRDALGHKTLAMTGRYVGRDADPLRQLADRVSGRIAAAMAGASGKLVKIAAKR